MQIRQSRTRPHLIGAVRWIREPLGSTKWRIHLEPSARHGIPNGRIDFLKDWKLGVGLETSRRSKLASSLLLHAAEGWIPAELIHLKLYELLPRYRPACIVPHTYHDLLGFLNTVTPEFREYVRSQSLREVRKLLGTEPNTGSVHTMDTNAIAAAQQRDPWNVYWHFGEMGLDEAKRFPNTPRRSNHEVRPFWSIFRAR